MPDNPLPNDRSLIQVDHVYFSHPGQSDDREPALQDISLEIKQGEYIALVGANGSGKTTLARHLNALLLPDKGRVLVDGLDTRHTNDHPVIRSIAGMVFQHPEDQLVATTVEEDVAFGPENLGIPPVEIRRRVDEALQTAGIWDARLRPPHLLSGGQIQRVALAGALALQPRLMIFDEATAMLDPAGRRAVLELMSRLNREGMTILSITHFMEDAVHARRLIVMEKGRIVLDGTPELVFSDAQRLESLGLELPRATRLAQRLRKYFPALPDPTYRLKNLLEQLPLYPGTALYPGTRLVDSAQQPSEPVNLDPDACIKVSHLGYTYMADTPMAYPAIRDVSMEVSTGEVHGIIGPTGSGKSTLLQHLNGLLRAQEGQIKVGPFDLNDPKVSVKDVCQVVGLVFQDPDMQIFEQFVGDEIAYGPRFFISDKAELRERVRWAMEQVGLDFDRFKDRRTGSLSGGERRKVALASILALKPDVLVLDEPTAGLDPVSRRELRSRLLSLKLAGTTLVISSHQMEDLALLADRMTVIYAGQDTYQGATRDVFAREDELTGLGLGVPAASTVAHRLIANGWPISSQICRVEELLAAIEQVYQGLPG